jgi:outer membrane protein OmpA-like peptidoglycan-associated protein
MGNDEATKQQILFDLKQENGKWKIEKISVPETKVVLGEKSEAIDPLNLADMFLQAVLKQNFEVALQWVDLKSVSETKIATLCILFEEGEYKMRKNKPLRAMFLRDDTVGYLAYIEAKDGSEAAQFSLSLRLDAETKKWRVFEINLDQLLADYATRVAGGDIYYSPLVKNPSGGETLALYFEFNEDMMSPRTKRQLEIVVSILKNDPKKKITLSGHTDALGTKSYNDQLSSNRADVVRDFLAAAGVSAEQIVTIAKGASQPRRPNVTETGEDDPTGRRANRRTEIYLDF